jgi:hypothetical protein
MLSSQQISDVLHLPQTWDVYWSSRTWIGQHNNIRSGLQIMMLPSIYFSVLLLFPFLGQNILVRNPFSDTQIIGLLFLCGKRSSLDTQNNRQTSFEMLLFFDGRQLFEQWQWTLTEFDLFSVFHEYNFEMLLFFANTLTLRYFVSIVVCRHVTG